MLVRDAASFFVYSTHSLAVALVTPSFIAGREKVPVTEFDCAISGSLVVGEFINNLTMVNSKGIRYVSSVLLQR